MPLAKVEPGTPDAKELAKWEQFPTAFTTDEDPPGNPYKFREFPKLLYKAVLREDGRAVCLEPEPVPRGGTAEHVNQFQFEMLQWERHNQRVCKRVQSADEEATARNDGWRESPAAALAHLEGLQQDIARAAAESAFAATKMSGKAQAERAALEQTSAKHVTK